mgnify:FL=1
MAQEHNGALSRLREHTVGLEAELARKIGEHSAAMKEKEKEVLDLRTALNDAKEQNLREEERNRKREQDLISEKGRLMSQCRDFQKMSDEVMMKYRTVCDQKDELTDSYIKSQEEAVLAKARFRAEWEDEVKVATAELRQHYERIVEVMNAEARARKTSMELLIAQYHAEAERAKEELETSKMQPGLDEVRLRILIGRHRQHLTKKVEEAFGRAGEEWAAQAAELHILRADAENRRKEGRGFYKMDEASIQTLRADLTEDYHTLVKSQTAAIEQVLEDFNDDQMLFRLEAEALEQEGLAARQTKSPTPMEQNDEPATENITEARQEEPAPAEGPAEHTEESSLGDTTTPAPTTKPHSPTPPLEQPAHTPDPENILDILEED